MYLIIVLYALNLHSVICQLYLNKAGKINEKGKKGGRKEGKKKGKEERREGGRRQREWIFLEYLISLVRGQRGHVRKYLR